MQIERSDPLLADDEWHRTRDPDAYSASYAPPRRRRRPRLMAAAVTGAIALVCVALVASFAFSTSNLAGGSVSLIGAKLRWLLSVDADRHFAVVNVGTDDYALARTEDGGRHWVAQALPEQVNRGLAVREPILVTARSVLIGAYLTRDDGRSWTWGNPSRPGQPALPLGDPIQTVPAGWPLRPYCTRSCEAAAIDPRTGVQHEISLFAGVRTDVAIHDPAGVLWVKTANRIYVSRNAGNSWSAREISDGATFAFAARGRYAYALTDGGAAVLRTLDAGQTWQTVASDIKQPAGDTCVLAGGELVAVVRDQDTTALSISRDHGATFRPVDRAVHPGQIMRAIDGTCVVQDRWQKAHWVVTDAGSLRRLPVPAT